MILMILIKAMLQKIRIIVMMLAIDSSNKDLLKQRHLLLRDSKRGSHPSPAFDSIGHLGNDFGGILFANHVFLGGFE